MDAHRVTIESIFAHTEIPFRMIYVDGGSPRYVQQYIQSKVRIKHFNVIRTDHYLFRVFVNSSG